MAGSMDSLVNRGQTDVSDKLANAVDKVKDIGSDIDAVKSGLSDMPGGLDSDLQQQIDAAREQARNDAKADVDAVKSDAVAEAKRNADTLKGEVNDKINANTQALDKLSKIDSKFGKAARGQASRDITANTDKGNSLLDTIKKAQEDADKNISDIQGSI